VPFLQFHIVTTHPQLEGYFCDGVVGRALKAGQFGCQFYRLRDFSEKNYRSVDGKSYGGGAGQVLQLGPLVTCHDQIMAQVLPGEAFLRVFFSPAGHLWQQSIVRQWLGSTDWVGSSVAKVHVLLFCGRYEGVDQRFLDHWIDLELSVGPYILSSGDLPALIVVDSLVRFLPGVLNNPQSLLAETEAQVQMQVQIAAPNFAPPREFSGFEVPAVLLNGDPKKIQQFERDWVLQHQIKPVPKTLTNQVKS